MPRRHTVVVIAAAIACGSTVAQDPFQIVQRFRAGKVVQAVGDVNGDQHPDFLAGDPDGNQVNLVSGRDFRPIHTWNGIEPRSGFGTALAVGDLNKDGTPDYVITAPQAQSGKGAFYLVNGKTNTIVAQGVGAGGNFGHAVVLADIAPFFVDGFLDIVVAAPLKDAGPTLGTREGEVRFYDGKNFSAQFIGGNRGSGRNDQFGTALAVNGNLNTVPGDDVVISAKGPYSSLSGCGGGYMVVTQGAGNLSQPIRGPSRTCFGSSLLVDDLDNDGEKEIFVGCGFNNRVSICYVYEFDKTQSRWGPNPSITINPNPRTLNLGAAVTRIPDMNNDGVRDLAIAGTEATQIWSAKSYLPLANFSYPSTSGGATINIEYVGDLDKDGAFEVLVGHNNDDPRNWSSAIQVWSRKKWTFQPEDNYLNATRGGRVDMSIDFGPARAGELYLVLASRSGMGSGLAIPGAGTLFLVPDPFLLNLIGMVNNSPFLNWAGFLDGNGRATASWASGALSGRLIPLRMHFAAIAIDFRNSAFSAVTNTRHFVVK